MIRPPSGAPPHHPWLRELGIALLAWTTAGAITSQVIYLYRPMSGEGRVAWIEVFQWTLPGVLLWTAATPAILALSRRLRWDRVPRAAFVIAHGGGAVTLHLSAALLEWSLRPWLRPSAAGAPLAAALMDGVVFDLARYLILVAGVHATEFLSLSRRHQREALELRAALLEAELAMLRQQLQPHFLFNALHALSELVYRDPRLADRAITRLAELLRASLAGEAGREIPLEAELELLDAYLDIERMRAGGALDLRFDIRPDAAACAVPGLLLQPLVENALRHGIRGHAGGWVEVGARRSGEWLEIRIADNGAGLPERVTEGIGLRTTRARLHGIHGAAGELALAARAGGGAVASVRIPARTLEIRRGDNAGRAAG